jgi:hypothetical protein
VERRWGVYVEREIQAGRSNCSLHWDGRFHSTRERGNCQRGRSTDDRKGAALRLWWNRVRDILRRHGAMLWHVAFRSSRLLDQSQADSHACYGLELHEQEECGEGTLHGRTLVSVFSTNKA